MRPCPDEGRILEKRAFTLVELTFTITLTSLFSVLLFSILNTTSRIWCENEENAGSDREARAALNLMLQELSSIYLEEFHDSATFLLNPDARYIGQSGIAADNEWASRLFFLATIPADGQFPGANRSDLCAIGYFLAYTPDNDIRAGKARSITTGSYKLYRFFRSSDKTFQILSRNDQITPLFEANPAVEAEIVANNVTRFLVKAYVNQPGGSIEWNSIIDAARPDFLEISLTVIGERDAASLGSRAAWENHDSAFHKKQERTFTARVRLQSLASPKPTP
jgi:hypothetical protein